MNTLDKTSGLFEEEGKKNRLLLNISENQKKALKDGSIGLGGVLAGGGLYSLFASSKLPKKNPLQNHRKKWFQLRQNSRSPM